MMVDHHDGRPSCWPTIMMVDHHDGQHRLAKGNLVQCSAAWPPTPPVILLYRPNGVESCFPSEPLLKKTRLDQTESCSGINQSCSPSEPPSKKNRTRSNRVPFATKVLLRSNPYRRQSNSQKLSSQRSKLLCRMNTRWPQFCEPLPELKAWDAAFKGSLFRKACRVRLRASL